MEEDTGSETPKKTNALKTLKRTIFTVVVILLLVGVAGFTYTWYADRNASVPVSKLQTPASYTPAAVKPPKVSANSQESASIELLDSPVVAGTQSSMTVKTNPGSVCTIKVVYDQKIVSEAAGLTPQTADDFGDASWTWMVDKTAPAGTWPATVTCADHGKTAVVIGQLQVTK